MLRSALAAFTPALIAFAYTTPPATTGVAGSCTISGNTVPISSFEVSYPANPFRAATGGVVMDYYLVAYCGVNANGNNEYVMGSFSTAAGTWAVDDTAGTLTVSGIVVPASYTGDTFDLLTGTADITSGTGSYSVVWGADNATERRTVVSLHKKITSASDDTTRASHLNQLRGALL